MSNKKTEQEELRVLMGQGIMVNIGRHKIYIKEPTLAVLDAMSVEWLQFPELDDDITTEQAINIARKEIRTNAKRMARVIAMAILGEKQFGLLGRLKLKRLTREIYHECKPTDLQHLVEVITATSGLVNFIVSMKLMSTAVTTKKKNVIES